ncbi:MAG: hypothetical protein ACYS0G_04310 [Planctomycetota bacterium]|jgi:methyl-accepting chemotaxis protein
MPLLGGIRNLIARKKAPLEIDVDEPPAEKRSGEVEATAAEPADESGMGMAEPVVDESGLDMAEPADESGFAMAEPAGRIAAEMAEPAGKIGYEPVEAAEKIGADARGVVAPPAPIESEPAANDLARILVEIDDRLGAQTAQTRRLMQPMEGLPQALDALEEIKQQSTRMLELLSERLDRAETRADAVDAAIDRIGDASSHHTEVLSAIQQQLDSNSQAIRHTSESYDAVTQNLREVLESSCKLQEVLSDLNQSTEDRETELTEHLARTRRSMLMFAFGCSAVSIIALIVAVLALAL